MFGLKQRKIGGAGGPQKKQKRGGTKQSNKSGYGRKK